jgi:hypothetical protein
MSRRRWSRSHHSQDQRTINIWGFPIKKLNTKLPQASVGCVECQRIGRRLKVNVTAMRRGSVGQRGRLLRERLLLGCLKEKKK